MSTEVKNKAVVAEDLVNIEVDGVAMQTPKGSMIIQATDKAGISIPRFCYHKKLTIAANCRMCLVDVEKAPKPMPACATPVMEGMKVFTQSRRAMDAQHGVMEFLLINHPLDCPICDQGGECELQDLAMGYGRSVSRFTERKRVVKDKNVGSLVQTDMTRCIHCTRCVRFLEEIAGTTEMGGSGRGDDLEIGTCVENSIDSELSGNIIDLCPVGALTDKPFRFAARAWELVAKPSIGVHDGIGSRLYHHALRGKILRSVPRENEAANETWLSDRDRYSHAGLYAEDRVTQPMVKKDGVLTPVSWDEGIDAAMSLLKSAGEQNADSICALMSPSAATEEYYLAQKLVRGLGSHNIDHRLREQDFSDDGSSLSIPVFEKKLAQIAQSDAVLLLGCNPRHEAPILGHRLRQAWQKGASLMSINPLDWEFVFSTKYSITAAPQNMVSELAAVAKAVSADGAWPENLKKLISNATVEEQHENMAAVLRDAEQAVVLLGQFAMSHFDASILRGLAAGIAQQCDCSFNVLPHGANSTGAWQAGAVPHRGPAGTPVSSGQNKTEMINGVDQTWLLWNLESDHDIDNPGLAGKAIDSAKAVVLISSFANETMKQQADVILPLAPLAESEGSVINLDGQRIGFSPAGKITGEARPGWKILRRLGDALGLDGFSYIDLTELQTEVEDAFSNESSPANMTSESAKAAPETTVSFELDDLFRVGEVPMFSSDSLCRRAPALQETVHADSDFVGLNSKDAKRLGLNDKDIAKVSQSGSDTELEVRISDTVPCGAAWVRSGITRTSGLGSAVAPISVEPV